MHGGRRYKLIQTLNWGRKYIFIFIIFDTIPVALFYFLGLNWLSIPWQPISLIGIAVAFYLGFKNNSSYERLWEARKIWGAIVNVSRSFAILARDFIHNDGTIVELGEDELNGIRKRLVHRHVAWLHALSIELRKLMSWEHNKASDQEFRKFHGVEYSPEKLQKLKDYLSVDEYTYVMEKGNKPSHILSMQSKDLMTLRTSGPLEHFRHLEMQGLITEMYTLQGQSERIKKFPFPRQYATVNFFFTVLFIGLLPFGMLNVFANQGIDWLIWLSIPFSVMGSWVFWTMEMIGDYSENPFEGMYNDVPIATMATDIEIDIRQMLDEEDLPEPLKFEGGMNIQL
ncbi:bestrophin family protein [Ekhidna sp.]